MKLIFLFTFIFSLMSSAQASIGAIAENWVKAQYKSKEATLEMVENYLDDDGVNFGGRYVGFGFLWDPTNEDGMVVTRVIEDGPAFGILEVGDQFISVNGNDITEDNVNSGALGFRGEPGQPVKAVVLRGGDEVEVDVTRGIVNPTYSKDQVLANINSAVSENWGQNLLDYQIGDVVVDEGKNLVYVWHWSKSIDDVSGNEVEAHNFTRMRFNENGLVAGWWTLSEDQLALEQSGWSITRG